MVVKMLSFQVFLQKSYKHKKTIRNLMASLFKSII